MERLGNGPKPGLTALAEPRKTSNTRKTPASTSSADLPVVPEDNPQLPSRGCKFQQPPALSRKTNSRSPLSQQTEGGSEGTTTQPQTPTASPPPRTTHQPSWKAPWPPVPIPSAPSEDAEEAEGRQQLRNQLQPEAPGLLCSHSPSSALRCSASLSCTSSREPPWLQNARGYRGSSAQQANRSREGRRGRGCVGGGVPFRAR